MRRLPDPLKNRNGWPWDVPSLSTPSQMSDGTPWPSVTIVTPSYNQAEYLEETIRSVLLQGYPNLEYIIMDGGSTDESIEIIEHYSNFLSSWVSQKDNGQSDAINSGFNQSKGEYLAWLNSDDVFLPGAIHKIIEQLYQKPNAGMAYGQTEVINEYGQRIGFFEIVDYSFIDLLTMKIILPQQAAFFKKSVLESLGYLRTDLHYAMDVELFIRIGASFDILFVNETLAQFRLTNSNKGVVAKTNWCPEFIKILTDFFESPVSEKYSCLRRAAFGGAYYRGAHTYLEAEEYSNAKKWLNLALKNNLRYFFKPGWWKANIFVLFGRPGKKIINKLLVWLRMKKILVNNFDWQTGLAFDRSQDDTEKNSKKENV